MKSWRNPQLVFFAEPSPPPHPPPARIFRGTSPPLSPFDTRRTDGSVDCSSHEYLAFKVVVWLLVLITQSIPIVYWLMLSPHAVTKLNPVYAGSPEGRMRLRKKFESSKELAPLKFLFTPYKCSFW